MLDWLRRWLGESTELKKVRAQLAEALNIGNQLAKSRDAVRARNQALSATFSQLLEPAESVECSKIRLRDRVEAEKFARRLENNLGDPPGTYEGYRCRWCPRHPLTNDHIWHITHTDPELRGKRGNGRKHKPGIGKTHISPAVMERLRLSAPSTQDGGAA